MDSIGRTILSTISFSTARPIGCVLKNSSRRSGTTLPCRRSPARRFHDNLPIDARLFG
jgi:hypothetical protein